MSLRDEVIVALDLETTGLDPKQDEIIEIGAVKFQGRETLDTFHTLVNPLCPLPPLIQNLTGITDDDLGKAPPLSVVAPGLLTFLGRHAILGQNIAFDLAFLSKSGIKTSAPAYDTLELANLLLPQLGSHALGSLAKQFGVDTSSAHRAVPDAQMTHQVFLALLRKALELDTPLLAEIQRLASYTQGSLSHIFSSLLEEKQAGNLVLRSPEGLPGINLSRLAPRGDVKPLSPKEVPQLLDPDDVVQHLMPQGGVARTLQGFEHRPQQVQMARGVVDAFNNSEHLVVEAGTGVGKSMAYLLPAIYYALLNDTRIVISTNTIGLQEQLIGKDIPLLAGALKDSLPEVEGLRAATLKGRGNYLCLTRWSQMRAQSNLSPAEASFLIKTLVWLQSTTYGDRGELSLPGVESALWDRVSAQSGDCSPEGCSYHRQGLCFLARARRRAEGTHLLVVNHALLLSDLAREGGLIPQHDHLIVDEAHHMEDEATRQLGFQLRDAELSELLNTLTSGTASGRARGLVQEIAYLAMAASPPIRRKMDALLGQLRSEVTVAGTRLTDFMRSFVRFAKEQSEEVGDYERQLRITRSTRSQPGWDAIEAKGENLLLSLEGVDERLGELQQGVLEVLGKKDASQDGVASDLRDLVQAFNDRCAYLQEVIFDPKDAYVYWCSFTPQGDSFALHGALLDVAFVLSQKLFNQKRTVVLTSATLAVEGSFDFLKNRLGIEGGRELLLDTPFDYKRSAALFIPTDMPDPTSSGYQDRCVQAILELGAAARGRTMVLFTSHAALRATYKAIYAALQEQGIRVLGQGIDGSPRQLMNAFQGGNRCVLLGTSTFWEGVDMPPETLKVLLIARLPFSVPTDPLFTARSQDFEDPFNQYALPQAVLRFKQGFGRLIRRQSDRGAIVVLDSRLSTKNYGSVFLRSIPPCTARAVPLRTVVQEAAAWINRES